MFFVGEGGFSPFHFFFPFTYASLSKLIDNANHFVLENNQLLGDNLVFSDFLMSLFCGLTQSSHLISLFLVLLNSVKKGLTMLTNTIRLKYEKD